MKTRLLSPLLLAAALLSAVFLTAPHAAAQTTDPAKVAELKAKFMAGKKLMDEGKLLEALDAFNEVLEEEPKARGSLMMAAIVNMNLARFSKAIELLNRFRALEPNDPNGLAMLIPAYQAVNKTKEAEEMIAEYKKLRASGTVPALTQEDFFVRERVPRPDGSTIQIYQFYDYGKAPYRLLRADLVNRQGKIARRLELAYDPEASKTVAAQDPKLKNARVFFLNENLFGADGKLQGVNVYRQVFAQPPYDKSREWLVDAILLPPKPIAKGQVQNGQVVFPAPIVK